MKMKIAAWAAMFLSAFEFVATPEGLDFLSPYRK
jgi:hypothetical protein